MLVFLLLLAQALSWWDNAHMLIAEIAFRDLDDYDIDKIKDVMKDWSREFRDDHEIYEWATWADAIKGYPEHTDSMATWHFSNIPYNPENIPLPESAKLDVETVDWAAEQALSSLERSKSRWSWNFNLRNLIHFVGDVSCPVHAITLYDHDFPNSDHGATRFHINGEDLSCGISMLHFVWDSVGCIYTNDWPLDSRQVDELRRNATALMKKYPKSFFPEFSEDDTDITKWVKETHEVAVKYVYTGISPGDKPSPEYLDNVFEISNQRITLAGYRLGVLLKKIKRNIPY